MTLEKKNKIEIAKNLIIGTMSAKLLTVADFQKEATNKLPKLARDYYNGGSEDERTLNRNHEAFESLLIRPRAFRDVRLIDPSVTFLGHKQSFPICVAPTAFHKMADHIGELSTVRGAAEAGSLLIASSWSTTPLEEMASEILSKGGRIWFQLYVYKERSTTEALIDRAEKAGCSAIVLTVDTPVLGRRLKDLRNAFNLPEGLELANFNSQKHTNMPKVEGGESGLMEYVTTQVESKLDWDLIKWIQSKTKLPLIVKGVMRADDALEAVAHGVNGIIVSNHGGRQLDSAPATIEALPEIVRAIAGKCCVFLDGGIRNGRDIFKAVALGASGVFVGRPVLWGLASKGKDGVKEVLNILQNEFVHTMKLAGMRTVEEMRKCDNLIVHESYFSKL